MSKILIGFGILLLYISSILFLFYYLGMNKYCKKNNIIQPKEEPQVIYSDRPTVTFKKMFLEPSIWLGYQSVPENS